MARSIASDDALCHQQCPYGQIAHHSIGGLPSPLSFMNIHWLLSSLLGFLLPSSCICINRYCSLYPSGLLIHRVVSVSHPCLNMEAILVPITLVLRLTGRMQLALSLASHNGTGADALGTLTFSFYFNLGVILIYSPRSYEAGAFLISALRGQPPALDNDFSMNLPFSLPTSLCLWAINKTCIHR